MNREWRNTRRLFRDGGILFGVLFLALLVNSFWQGQRLKRVQAVLIEQGEVLDWRKLEPIHVQLASNGGNEFQAAMEGMPRVLLLSLRGGSVDVAGYSGRLPLTQLHMAGRFDINDQRYWGPISGWKRSS